MCGVIFFLFFRGGATFVRLGTGVFGSCDLFWRQVLGELKPRANYGNPRSCKKDIMHEVGWCCLVFSTWCRQHPADIYIFDSLDPCEMWKSHWFSWKSFWFPRFRDLMPEVRAQRYPKNERRGRWIAWVLDRLVEAQILGEASLMQLWQLWHSLIRNEPKDIFPYFHPIFLRLRFYETFGQCCYDCFGLS